MRSQSDGRATLCGSPETVAPARTTFVNGTVTHGFARSAGRKFGLIGVSGSERPNPLALEENLDISHVVGRIKDKAYPSCCGLHTVAQAFSVLSAEHGPLRGALLMMRTLVTLLPAMSFTALVCGPVWAQSFPGKPISIITSEPGGALDLGARLLAQGIPSGIGQSAIVVNRPAIISVETVAKAPPDGYTLLVGGGNIWIAPFLGKMSYDPVRDFAPISMLATTPNILAVHPSLPVKSAKELIALAKTRPGELNFGSTGSGGTTHLSAELFKAMAGVNFVHIAYKGNTAALSSLIGGEVQLMFASAASAMTHVRSGRLKALAVTSSEPSVLAPGLPTVAATGLSGFDVETINGVLAPAKTPTALINRLNQEIVRVLNSADVKEKFFNAGAEALGSSPEQFGVRIKSEMTKWGKLIKDIGIGADQEK